MDLGTVTFIIIGRDQKTKLVAFLKQRNLLEFSIFICLSPCHGIYFGHYL